MNHDVLRVGNRFEMPDEGIYGYIDKIVDDDDGDPAALLIACDNGKWASVSIANIELVPATLH